MKIQRFNTISSLPGTMKIEEYVIPDKEFDKSIVDKSCFTPLDSQLKKLTPMTASEAEQHFDFVNGKDDGRPAPLHKGADLAEISMDIRAKQQKIGAKVAEAEKKMQAEIQHKAMQESVKAELSNKK